MIAVNMQRKLLILPDTSTVSGFKIYYVANLKITSPPTINRQYEQLCKMLRIIMYENEKKMNMNEKENEKKSHFYWIERALCLIIIIHVPCA